MQAAGLCKSLDNEVNCSPKQACGPGGEPLSYMPLVVDHRVHRLTLNFGVF